MRNLFAEYAAENAELMAFYAHPPAALFEERPNVCPWDQTLAKALNEYQARVGGAAMVRGDEALIVTGQQPGLFTGPLYTVYKAITAIRLAEKMRDRFGVACIPVFWIGADDHDFEEARTAHFLTKNHEPLSLRYAPAQSVDGLPMYRVPLEESLHALVDRAAAETPGSEFRGEIAGFLHESLRASESLADSMARLLARLFRGTPLIVFSPTLPVARVLAASVIEREIAEPLVTTRLLNEAGARLEALGFSRPIAKADTDCAFFLEVNRKRRKVVFDSGRYRVPEDQVDYAPEELLRVLRDAPERFSPNVALRCVVQQRLFPAVAYVGGPGEVAYWAQLKPVFERFGLAMPVVYPRAQGVLMSRKLRKLLEKFGFSLADLEAPQETLVDRALRAGAGNPALQALRARRAALDTSVAQLAADVSRHGPVARTLAERFEHTVTAEAERLERALLRADAEQTETVRKQVARLGNTLAPWRKPQERVYTVFSFLFEQGWALLPRLIRELDMESFTMNEVEL